MLPIQPCKLFSWFFSEEVMADKPLIAVVETKELGTGKEKQPPIVPPLFCFAYSVGFYKERIYLIALPIHFLQPGFQGISVMSTRKCPLLFQGKIFEEVMQ